MPVSLEAFVVHTQPNYQENAMERRKVLAIIPGVLVPTALVSRATASGATLLGALSGIRPAVAAQCTPTQRDALGPFFVSNAPTLADLNRHARPGERMQVSGEVREAGSGQAVPAAVLEVWQTDGEGRYHPQNNGDVADYKDAEIDLRGAIVCNAQGQFAYATVVPGRYAPRPRHFHLRVSAPRFKTLITQHYVSDGENVPGGACRSARIDRSSGEARFVSPTVYLARA
jgi:protocatechuate 3,4-dioxygenase beta subunit